MTDFSKAEQGGAGLDRLTGEEYERFDRLNRAYRERFGFPFSVCVRNHTKHSILEAFERRDVAHLRQESVVKTEVLIGEDGPDYAAAG